MFAPGSHPDSKIGSGRRARIDARHARAL